MQVPKKDYNQCVFGPGYVVLSSEPALLCSVCGNGVIVTVWDRVRRCGGMIHCVYPVLPRGTAPTNYYVDIALPNLLKRMGVASRNHRFDVQIFGGGDLQGYAQRRASKVINAIKKILKKRKVLIVSEDIGGATGRKIMFNTFTGDVAVLKTKHVRDTDWTPEYLIDMGRYK